MKYLFCVQFTSFDSNRVCFVVFFLLSAVNCMGESEFKLERMIAFVRANWIHISNACGVLVLLVGYRHWAAGRLSTYGNNESNEEKKQNQSESNVQTERNIYAPLFERRHRRCHCTATQTGQTLHFRENFISYFLLRKNLRYFFLFRFYFANDRNWTKNANNRNCCFSELCEWNVVQQCVRLFDEVF